jgi:hypothetical protein
MFAQPSFTHFLYVAKYRYVCVVMIPKRTMFITTPREVLGID